MFLGLAFRLYGIGRGYPDLVAGDEQPVCRNALRFLVLHTLEPEHFSYPALYSYLFGAALVCYYALGGLWQLGQLSLSAGFTWYFRPVGVALVGRGLSVVFGVLTVPATFALSRAAYGVPTGRVAAGVVAAVTLVSSWAAAVSGGPDPGTQVRLQAARWLEENVPSGTTLGVYSSENYPRLKTVTEELPILREMLALEELAPAVRLDLERLARQERFYRWIPLEYSLDHVEVPETYAATVDVGDPKVRRVFSRAYLTFEEMRAAGVAVVVLPQASYGRFFSNPPPPAGTAERYHYDRNRAYIEGIISRPQRFQLATTCRARARGRELEIHIYRVGGAR